jgi:hypothetical protein
LTFRLYAISWKVVLERSYRSSSFDSIRIDLSVSETLDVIVAEYALRDGNDNELLKKLILLGKRSNGETIEISPYWLFSRTETISESYQIEDRSLLLLAKRYALSDKARVQRQRQNIIDKKQDYLQQAFTEQLKRLNNRLREFIDTNQQNRNSANINKYKTMIKRLERRRDERIEQIAREGTVKLQLVDELMTLHAKASPNCWRLIPKDYELAVELFEELNGRKVRMLPAYGLADFVSEDEEGNSRYILIAKKFPLKIENEQDYLPLLDQTYIYLLSDGLVTKSVLIRELI